MIERVRNDLFGICRKKTGNHFCRASLAIGVDHSDLFQMSVYVALHELMRRNDKTIGSFARCQGLCHGFLRA